MGSVPESGHSGRKVASTGANASVHRPQGARCFALHSTVPAKSGDAQNPAVDSARRCVPVPSGRYRPASRPKSRLACSAITGAAFAEAPERSLVNSYSARISASRRSAKSSRSRDREASALTTRLTKSNPTKVMTYCESSTASVYIGGTRKKSNASTPRIEAKIDGPRPYASAETTETNR